MQEDRIDSKTCEKLGIKSWYEGRDFSIYYSLDHNPTARDAVDSLSEDLSESDQRLTRAFLIKLVDNQNLLKKRDVSKPISKNLYRLSPNQKRQVRFMYLREGANILIITHAFIKKKNPISPEEIDRGKRIKSQYEARKGERV